jgi:hypothetical protein
MYCILSRGVSCFLTIDFSVAMKCERVLLSIAAIRRIGMPVVGKKKLKVH